MISAIAGQSFVAEVDAGGDSTLAGVLGVTLKTADEVTTVIERMTAGILEHPAGSGIYRVALLAPESPDDPTEYLLVWDLPDVEEVAREVVQVFARTDPAALPAWAPTVQDVADLCPAYTRRPIDDPFESAGAEHGIFDDTTSPTAGQVQVWIVAAVQEVAGRVSVGRLEALNEWADLARRTAAWHAAASVEAEKDPEGTTEAEGAYRWKQASYVACLTELIDQARRRPLRIA